MDIKVLYSNKTESDILLLDELNAINAECGNITITHTLTNTDQVPHWARSGMINWPMIKELGFPEPSEETLVAFCGPPGLEQMLKETLAKEGYDASMIHCF